MADEYLFEKKNIKLRKFIFRLIITIIESAVVVLLAFLLINNVLGRMTIVGNSMNTTLKADDDLIYNRLAYIKNEPERFDIIVFNQGGKEHIYLNVKRIIGVPGDTVQIVNGKIYINDDLLDEKINVEKMVLSGIAAEPVELMENEFFVLGDNRNASEDSRFSTVGIVTSEQIVGKVIVRLNPFALVDQLNVIIE